MIFWVDFWGGYAGGCFFAKKHPPAPPEKTPKGEFFKLVQIWNNLRLFFVGGMELSATDRRPNSCRKQLGTAKTPSAPRWRVRTWWKRFCEGLGEAKRAHKPLVKVWVKPFQRLAGCWGGAPTRAPQSAKLPKRPFLLQSFSLGQFWQRKA